MSVIGLARGGGRPWALAGTGGGWRRWRAARPV